MNNNKGFPPHLKSVVYSLAIMLCFFGSSPVWAQSQKYQQAGERQRNNHSENKIADLLAPKVEYVLEHNSHAPLGSGGNGMGQVKPIAQTILTGFQEGIGGRTIFASPAFSDTKSGLADMQAYRIGCYNCTITDLFQMAYYDGQRRFDRNRIMAEVREPLKIRNTKDRGMDYEEWLRAGNGYTYEAIAPFALGRKRMYENMRRDMTEYFPQYAVSIEKRSVECLLLEVVGDTGALIGEEEEPKVEYSPIRFHMSNAYGIDYLVERLRYYLQNEPPVVNRTGIQGKISIDIRAPLSNVAELNGALKTYGLHLRKGIYEIDMLVIKDSGHQPVHLTLNPDNYEKTRGFDWESLKTGTTR